VENIMSVEIIRDAEGKLSLKCAFCKGRGTDPFELLSKLSVCQVCTGKEEVTIRRPAIECAYWGGNGIHREQRLTCMVCGGKAWLASKIRLKHVLTARGRVPSGEITFLA
jgi:DnaJ-class molecular chaperone